MTRFDDPTESAAAGSFVEVPDAECRELLAIGVIGHVAFNSSTGIQLIPLNYLYLNEHLYFRVDNDSTLGELGRGDHETVFEVDYHDDLLRQAWSVVVKGRVTTVTEPAELESLEGKRALRPWALGERQLVLRLEPATISGRKVTRHAR